jgi:osmotically-inducible protein OsmY
MGKGMEVAVIYRDEDIALRVEEFLSRQHFPSFQQLDIEVTQGKLTVRGGAESFYEKQVAMSVCQHVPGVLQFVDEISVNV